MKRITVFLATFVAVMFVGVAPATASSYPPGLDLTLSLSQNSGNPNFEFTATMHGCYPGELVEFTIYTAGGSSAVIGPVAATCSLTTFQASVTFNAPGTIGNYTVTGVAQGPASGEGATRPQSRSADITVRAGEGSGGGEAGGGQPGGNLPNTGANGVSNSLTVAAIVVAVGIGLVAVTFVRRRSADA